MSAAPRCPRLAETLRLVAARAEDRLSGAESRALKEHLSGCRPCADAALRLDPTLLFAPLSVGAERPSRAESGEARRLAADVLSAIELERARRRLSPAAPRVALRAASVALLAGGLLALLRGSRPAPQPPSVVLRTPVRAEAPVSAARDSAPLVIDDLRNREATVYQFASTSSQEPNVVFVVDRNADI